MTDLLVRVSLDGANFRAGAAQMQQQVEKMQKAVKSGATGMVDFDRVTAQLKASAETLTQRLEKQREKVQTLETAYKKSKEETGENSEKIKKVAE